MKLYVVVCRITGNVFGPWTREGNAIVWAKSTSTLQTNSWYVAPILPIV